MSVSAVRLICDISAPQKDGLLESFNSRNPATQGIYFRGDKPQLEFYPVKQADGSATLFWLPVDGISASDLSLAIGDPDLASTSGTTALNYDGDGTGLTAVSATVAESTLETLLNANPAVALTGQTVEVTLLSAGNYKIAWSGVGAKELFEGDPAALVPESVVVADWLQEGDGNTRAIQLLRFLQRPFVFVDAWTATSGAAATVETLRVGDDSPAAKAMFSVSISPLPYAGSFSIKDSGPLAYNGSEAEWQSAMGTGWTVLKTGDASLTIERTAAEVYTLVSGDIDVAGLSVYNGFTGTLNFNKTAIFERFASETGDTFQTDIHIRVDDGTNINTLHYGTTSLHRALLSSGSLSPSNWNNGFYRKTEIDAFLASLHDGASASVSAAGDTAVTKASATTKRFIGKITVGAGSGAYTRTVSLSATNAAEDDEIKIILSMPASENPTIEIRNATSGGTLLYTLAGTGSAFTSTLTFTFNGTAWTSDQ